MSILDSLDEIKKLDQSSSLESISMLPEQCKDAWYAAKKVDLPADYRNVASILFCAMGGSAYAAHIMKHLFIHELSVPIDIVNGYHLPHYAGEQTLIIAASYSGGTEETISCANEAFRFDPKMIGVTSGGELKEIISRNLKPVYEIIPAYNPSMQPRLGQGYMIMGQMSLLRSLGFLKIDDAKVDDMIGHITEFGKHLTPDVPTDKNQAKQLALLCKDVIVNLIGGEFLQGAIHAVRNPFHETGKHYAEYNILPELNHHLMEGLKYPESVKTMLLFLIFNSMLYSPQIRKRLDLTREVITNNGVKTHEVKLLGTDKLTQVMELVQLGSFVTFYLAMLHGVDPAKIPWVDYFKEKLKQ